MGLAHFKTAQPKLAEDFYLRAIQVDGSQLLAWQVRTYLVAT